MIALNILTDMCNWWWLWWLLPFILGYLLGRALMKKWETRCEELESNINSLDQTIIDLNAALEDCKASRIDLEGKLAIANGIIREAEIANASGSESLERSTKISSSEDVSTASSSLAGSTTTTSSSSSSSSSSMMGLSGLSGGKFDKLKEDNLQVIEGIGPKMNSVLIDNGVNSWSVLASKSEGELKQILGKYGDKYRIIDPSDWPSQAALAANGDWSGLIQHQKADGSESKAEKLLVRLGILKAFKENDLKAIEGIGPKIEKLLNDAGILTWKSLANTSVEKIREVLEAAGDRFKLADPETWPKQADYAANGQWDELEKYQDFLDGGRNPG